MHLQFVEINSAKVEAYFNNDFLADIKYIKPTTGLRNNNPKVQNTLPVTPSFAYLFTS